MKNENINENPILSGIPVEFECDEPWRKKRLSCSGAGIVEKNFDRRHFEHMTKYHGGNSSDGIENEEESGGN